MILSNHSRFTCECNKEDIDDDDDDDVKRRRRALPQFRDLDFGVWALEFEGWGLRAGGWCVQFKNNYFAEM